MKNVEEKIFLLIAFFLGTWGALLTTIQTTLIAIGLGYNIVKYRQEFLSNLKKYKWYISIPVIFLVYMAIHTFFIINSGKYAEYKIGTSFFERGLLFFLMGALYVLSLKSFMSEKLLKKSLFIFCISVFTYNLYTIYYLTGFNIFFNPFDTIFSLYQSRFGDSNAFGGGKVFLNAQALHLYTAALITYCLAGIEKLKKKKNLLFILFFFFLWFLSMTISKTAILCFFIGFIVYNIHLFRKLSIGYKTLLLGLFIMIGIVGITFAPQKFETRWVEMLNEINDIKEGRLHTGWSITPRYVLYKSSMEHIDEYALLGLGVYTNSVTKKWYMESGNATVADLLTHSHNSFLQYWMIGGIVGLLYILCWFIAPLIKMRKDKKISYLPLSIILIYFLDNNSDVHLILSDSAPIIVFFLAMFYFYNEYFYKMENESFNKLVPSNK